MKESLSCLRKTFVFLFLISVFCCQNLFSQGAPENYTGVMLQGFYWDSYKDANAKWTGLTSQADEIAQYFDLVWLPPSGYAMGNGMGYLPVYYFNQNSIFGTQEQLKTLISTLKSKGVGSIADIVVNHRNGVSNWTNFPSESYKGITYSWGPETICSDDEVKDQPGQAKPTGAPDTGEGYSAARDIDHTNENVRNTIKAYLDFMKNEMGYIGWRYDYAKGFAPKYFAEYNMAAGCDYSIAEYFDGDYNKLSGFIDGTKVDGQIRSGVFDFALKFELNKACNNGSWGSLVWKRYGILNQPAGVIHMDGYARFAYTFVDNHDTWRPGTSDHVNALTSNILAANAFIVSQPGIPCVFYLHWRDYKDKIKEMIDARKFVGVHNQSAVEVLQTSGNIYVAKVAGLTGSLIVKVGPGSYTAPSDYTMRSSGENYAIWTNGGQEPAQVKVSMTPDAGVYEGGTTVTLNATGGQEPYAIYYTTDGTEPTTSSTKVSNGAQINIATTTTVKEMAIDNAGMKSLTVSKTYYTETQSVVTVSWKNDLNWSGDMYLYAWDATGPLLGAWPGKKMDADVRGWYSYKFDKASVNVIFNNGMDKPQTVDIENITENSCFKILNQMEGKNYKIEKIACPEDSPLSIENINYNAGKIGVYPNPVTTEFYVVGVKDIDEVSIYSINGVLMKTVRAVEGAVDINEFPSGIYFVKITDSNSKQYHTKIVKR